MVNPKPEAVAQVITFCFDGEEVDVSQQVVGIKGEHSAVCLKGAVQWASFCGEVSSRSKSL